jgi:hypothetical protein
MDPFVKECSDFMQKDRDFHLSSQKPPHCFGDEVLKGPALIYCHVL